MKNGHLLLQSAAEGVLYYISGDDNVDDRNVLFHFSGTYRQQDFYREKSMTEIDCEKLRGTNCCLDGEAREWLEETIETIEPGGIHFLDSGNYHYMTRLWLEQIETPFDLLVLDHHTDMDPPMMGEILTCGSWLRDAMDGQKDLREVYLIGPTGEDAGRISGEYREKMHILTQEQMKEDDHPEEISDGPPVYISIDKDVMGETWARTGWSQGDMSLKEMCGILDDVMETRDVLGVGICGECVESGNVAKTQKERRINEKTNRMLLEFLEERKKAGFFE